MYINGFCALGQIKRFIGALVMGATNISYYGTSIKKSFPTCFLYIIVIEKGRIDELPKQ